MQQSRRFQNNSKFPNMPLLETYCSYSVSNGIDSHLSYTQISMCCRACSSMPYTGCTTCLQRVWAVTRLGCSEKVRFCYRIAINRAGSQKQKYLKPLVVPLESRWGVEDFVRIAHTGCETGCFLPFAGVLSVLKLPHFVRFLSSFSARYRRRCYMGCYIFGIRSGLPHALFRRINHPVVNAPQPIYVRRW